MTNFEAILKNREKFEDWVKIKGGVDKYLMRQLLVVTISELIDCKECPLKAECFTEGACSCLANIKWLLNQEYKE